MTNFYIFSKDAILKLVEEIRDEEEKMSIYRDFSHSGAVPKLHDRLVLDSYSFFIYENILQSFRVKCRLMVPRRMLETEVIELPSEEAALLLFRLK